METNFRRAIPIAIGLLMICVMASPGCGPGLGFSSGAASATVTETLTTTSTPTSTATTPAAAFRAPGGAAIATPQASPSATSATSAAGPIAIDCQRQLAYVAIPKPAANGDGEIAVVDIGADPDLTDPRLLTIDLGRSGTPIGVAIDSLQGVAMAVSAGFADLINEETGVVLASVPIPTPAASPSPPVAPVLSAAIDPTSNRALIVGESGTLILSNLDAGKGALAGPMVALPADPSGNQFEPNTSQPAQICDGKAFIVDETAEFLAAIDLTLMQNSPAAIGDALPSGRCAGSDTKFACSNRGGVVFLPVQR